jgi:hypothetical protein
MLASQGFGHAQLSVERRLRSSDALPKVTARNIPGITFTSTTLAIAETPEKYPSHGRTIPAIHFTITDRTALDTPELGIIFGLDYEGRL